MNNLAYVRIALRVFAGILIGFGLDAEIINELSIDPDVIDIANIILGAAIWGATELWYAAAKRFGWKT